MSEQEVGMRVLAVAEDQRGLVTACRVHAPLLALVRLGFVSEYLVTDSSLTNVPRGYPFDVLWVQRAPEARLAERIAEHFSNGYLHDMDDLLVTEPDYVQPGEFPAREPLVGLLAQCAVITTPSHRLLHLLEQHARLDLLGKSVICPNALEFPRQPPRVPERPRGLLLTQSHRLALTESREEVLGAIRRFAQREDLPIYYFGPPLSELGADVQALLGAVVPCGYLDFWRYHAVLAAWPALLAVAPLETVSGEATLAFVAGKSDVKMVEYGGFGHPGVYSRATPYVESDLEVGRLAANTGADWEAALTSQVEVGWHTADQEQVAVVAARALDGVAARCWEPALRKARLPEPVTVDVLRGDGSDTRSLWGRFSRVRAVRPT